MGPRLFGFTKGETKYSFRLFPIGGYCAMEGEDGPAEESDESSVSPEENEIVEDDGEKKVKGDPRAFYNAKIWKRMLIIIAGAVNNILLGIILVFITLIPKDEFVSNQVSVFSPCSFSAVSGLQPGDKIVKVNGYDVNTSTDFSFALFTLPLSEVDGDELTVYKEDCAFDLYAFAGSNITEKTTAEANNSAVTLLQESQNKLSSASNKEEAYKIFCEYYDRIAGVLGTKVEEYPDVTDPRDIRKRYRTDMTVIRDGERVELKDVDFLTTSSSDSDKPQLSIDFYVEPIEKNFGTVISQTFAETVSNVRMVWGGLIGLITGKFSINDMSGPVGIASAITEVASVSLERSGFGSAVSSIVYIMMIITINLGIVNMLPFPALDGGRFLMLLLEGIFRKPIPRKVETAINTVGLVLLLGLSAFIAVKDVVKLFIGG